MIAAMDPRPRILALPVVGALVRWLVAPYAESIRRGLEEQIDAAEGDAASYRRSLELLHQAQAQDVAYFNRRIDALQRAIAAAKGGQPDA